MRTDVIRLRYAGACSVCGAALPASTKAHWDSPTKTVTCLGCRAIADESESSADLPVDLPPVPPAPVKPESGRAGASAQKEYERRHQKREGRARPALRTLRRTHQVPRGRPQSTRVWAKGSQDERLLAEALTRRIGNRAVLLFDRKIPRSSANIDHLAIAATGVWIIDAKKYKGRLQRP